MNHDERGADRSTRWMVGGGVLLIHVALVAGLIRAFTPQLADTVVEAVTQAFTVTPSAAPSPPPPPSAVPSSAPQKREGASGEAGKKAVPREVSAPTPPIVIASMPAPPVSGAGKQNASGQTDHGAGTGGAASGQGTGAGLGGSGEGGGGGSPTVKIKGDINSAKDYPRASRERRIGASVTIDLVVGIDGRAKDCRIVQASPDPEADRITCDLAARRFRFRPALDQSGQPKEAVYRWRQRWFY